MVVQELGHIVLYVRSVARSRRFYGDVLGWKEIKVPAGFPGALFSSGRTHHELLLLEVGEDAPSPSAGRRTGLYHFGLKVGTTDDELAAMLSKLQENKVPVLGATDHGVTHSLYIADPDGNEIELYIDVQPERWREDPQLILSPPRPLRLATTKAAGR